jgi:hypothetical protein
VLLQLAPICDQSVGEILRLLEGESLLSVLIASPTAEGIIATTTLLKGGQHATLVAQKLL